MSKGSAGAWQHMTRLSGGQSTIHSCIIPSTAGDGGLPPSSSTCLPSK
jgi:hypothetical protein